MSSSNRTATNPAGRYFPVGLSDDHLDRIQQELLGCCNLIQPPYFPILSVEEYGGKKLIVLWAPGGQNRPYKAPQAVTAKHKTYHYYIRRYASTIEARGEAERECSAWRPQSAPSARR
jgi:ATP-dependent DNA helicase RecG